MANAQRVLQGRPQLAVLVKAPQKTTAQLATQPENIHLQLVQLLVLTVQRAGSKTLPAQTLIARYAQQANTTIRQARARAKLVTPDTTRQRQALPLQTVAHVQ